MESEYLGDAPDQLKSLLGILDTLPKCIQVYPLHCEISDFPAFFPGGRGYKGKAFPDRPVMFLGHNFDSESNFKRSVERGFEGDSRFKTWPNLLDYFLPEAGLKIDECFFTNFYLGAIAEKPAANADKKQKNTGRFKCSAAYRAACITNIKKQVEIVIPSVIALLGGNVAVPFSEAFPGYKSLASENLTQTQGKQPLGGYRLHFGGGMHAQVIALVHPSNPRSNESHKAQGNLLKAALQEFSR